MGIQRTILKQTPSGTLDLVWDGALLRLEFNTTCLDSLPYCKGMCCRMRVGFSVELEPDEVDNYQTRKHPTREGVYILAAKEGNTSCVYLNDETSLCTIHERKPRMCRAWGCSPGTERDDLGIERRDAGWVLLPFRKEEAELVQLQLGGKQNGGTSA